MDRQRILLAAIIAANIAVLGGCRFDAEHPEASTSTRSTPPPDSTTSNVEHNDSIECREDFDCCENPNAPCGRTCNDGTCIDAPPVEPAIELSVAQSWGNSDLLTLPIGTPALVRTVIEGFEPEDLHATFRGFVANPITLDSRDRYLLMETDPADERWNLVLGPVAGMSGSPIIIEGRLAGALSFTVGDTVAPFLFIATPIEAMLAVHATPLPTSRTSNSDPLTAMLTVSGPGAELFADAEWLDDRFLTIPDGDLGADGFGTGEDAPPLVPGSAISVRLVEGDILNLSGVGTVTAIDDDAIWAFGHPMSWSGPTALSFGAAEVLGIAANSAFGAYKIAAPVGPPLGTITEDRVTAIAGRFGPLPERITIHTVATLDGDAADVRHAVSRAQNNPPLTADLVSFASVWPITVLRDRFGAGSITYTLRVTVAETDLVGERADVVSSTFEPASELFFGFFMDLVSLMEDERVPLTLEAIEFIADVSDDRRELTVDAVESANQVAPGDELVVAVRLLPFGSSVPQTRAFVLDVPSDFPMGSATLEVGSEMAIGIPQDDRTGGEDDEPTTAEDVITAFSRMPHQRTLVARLTALGVTPVVPDCPPCGDDTPCEPCEPPPPPDEPPLAPSIRETLDEDGVVNGYETVTIEITEQ